MEDNQLWATFWKAAAVTISVIAISVAGCTAHQNYVQEQAIVKSSNPTAVSCSFQSATTQATAFCTKAAER